MEVINRVELEKFINFDEIFKKTQEAFQLFSQKKTITPPFTVFTIPHSNGSVHFKSGYVVGNKYFALEYSGAFYENHKIGLSNFQGLFIVFNATTGEVEAVIDDKGYLTDYRTGIAGAIATSALANYDSEVVAMIGTGVQARMQIRMLMKVMKIKTLKIWGRNIENVKVYADDIKSEFSKLKINICDKAEDAVRDADIIYTTTYSEKPLIKSQWIKNGAHITAIGACEPNMQELDENIFKRANIVCADSLEACAKNGEIHHAIEQNIIKASNVVELGAVLLNKIKRKPNDITICDLVGVGFQDAAIANCIMENYNKEKER